MVLIDAPCTGTGTWRRRPDTKWRLRPQALEARQAEQTALLSSAAGLPRPGGRIAYVTCSFLRGENGARIAAFRAAHANYRAVPAARLAAAVNLADGAYGACDHGILLSPLKTGTDAFYISVLEAT